MKQYSSLFQDAPVTYYVAYYEEIEANHAYSGLGLSVSDILRECEENQDLHNQIKEAVKNRLI